MGKGNGLLNISNRFHELCKILYLCSNIRKNDSPMSTNDKSELEAWLFLFYILICSILQAINFHHALNNNDKPLAIKMILLQIIGIIFAVWPILVDIDYSIRYMVQHDIFSSFP